jgi:SAM-dependent methyltransferase
MLLFFRQPVQKLRDRAVFVQVVSQRIIFTRPSLVRIQNARTLIYNKLHMTQSHVHNEAPPDFVEKYYTDDLAERDTPETHFALKWAKEIKGASVLSIGCGPQFYDDVQFFGEIPKEYTGIDINKNNIEFLREPTHPEARKWKQFLEEHGTSIGLKNGNIKEKQPGFLNHFDAVYAVGVLGMFSHEETGKIFELLYSYLKPEGILVDVDWTDPYLSEKKLKERESFEWYSKRGPSVQEIGNLFEKSGFLIKKFEEYTVPNPQEYKWGKIYGYVLKK